MARKTAEEKRQEERSSVERYAQLFEAHEAERRRANPGSTLGEDEEVMFYLETKVPRLFQRRVFERIRGKELPWFFD